MSESIRNHSSSSVATLALDDESEPEPDISLVPGTWRNYCLA